MTRLGGGGSLEHAARTETAASAAAKTKERTGRILAARGRRGVTGASLAADHDPIGELVAVAAAPGEVRRERLSAAADALRQPARELAAGHAGEDRAVDLAPRLRAHLLVDP